MQMEATRDTDYVTFQFEGIGVCDVVVGRHERRMNFFFDKNLCEYLLFLMKYI